MSISFRSVVVKHPVVLFLSYSVFPPPLSFSTGANIPEQILMTPYACDLNNPMELERRTISLQQWIDLLENDIARERKAKDGIQHLAQVRPCYPTLVSRVIGEFMEVLIPFVFASNLQEKPKRKFSLRSLVSSDPVSQLPIEVELRESGGGREFL